MFKTNNKRLKKIKLSVKVPPSIPAQNNFWDCGVFVAMICKYLVLDQDFNFDTKSMSSIRQMMKRELESGKIDPEVSNCPGLSLESINEDIKHQKCDEVTSEKIMQRKTHAEKNTKTAMNEKDSTEDHSSLTKNQSEFQCFTFNNFGVETAFETNGTDTIYRTPLF